MRKATLIGGVVLLVAVMAWPVLAQGPGYGRGGYGMGPGYGPGWAGLSQEDLKKLRDSRQKFRDETRGLNQEIRIKRAELRALMVNPESKDEDVVSKHKELKELTNQMSEKRLAHRLELRKQYPELADRLGDGWGRGKGYGRGGYGRGGYGRGGWGQGGCWY